MLDSQDFLQLDSKYTCTFCCFDEFFIGTFSNFFNFCTQFYSIFYILLIFLVGLVSDVEMVIRGWTMWEAGEFILCHTHIRQPAK